MANAQTPQAYIWHYAGQNTFGSFLKRERTRCGLSRHSLAVITGIQERRLRQIELNQSPPSYQDMKNFAAVLEIPEQDLLEAAGCIKRERGD
jgi:transcriptional regulator with XRE-family HTH domain